MFWSAKPKLCRLPSCTFLQYWMANEPTPPAPACTRIFLPLLVSPSFFQMRNTGAIAWIVVKPTKGSPAASLAEILEGTWAMIEKFVTRYSWKAPQELPCKGSIPYTESPGLKPRTPSPTRSTCPEKSKPDTMGRGLVKLMISFRRILKSTGFKPPVPTLISTCVISQHCGRGIRRVLMTEGSPGSRNCAARMVCSLSSNAGEYLEWQKRLSLKLIWKLRVFACLCKLQGLDKTSLRCLFSVFNRRPDVAFPKLVELVHQNCQHSQQIQAQHLQQRPKHRHGR